MPKPLQRKAALRVDRLMSTMGAQPSLSGNRLEEGSKRVKEQFNSARPGAYISVPSPASRLASAQQMAREQRSKKKGRA